MSSCSMQRLAADACWTEAFSYFGQTSTRCRPASVVEVLGRLFFLDVSDVSSPRVMCTEQGQAPTQYGPPCKFSRPSHITKAPEALGGLLVTDTGNHRIMHLAPGAAEWRVIAGGKDRGCNTEQLCFPRAAASLQDGGILVADSNNHRVLLFAQDAAEGLVVAGGRGAGKGLNQLHGPCCIALAPNNDLLVADTLNNRILHFSRSSWQTKLHPATGHATQGTPLLDQVVHNPVSIATTKAGGVVVADAGRVIHLAPCARIGKSLMQSIRFPQGVLVNDDGHVIIVDTDKCRIHYLLHRQGLKDLLLQQSRKTGKTLLAKLGSDILEKICSFL